MLKWIKRFKVNKEEGHVVWVDLYQDMDTGIQYFGMGNTLSPRFMVTQSSSEDNTNKAE